MDENIIQRRDHKNDSQQNSPIKINKVNGYSQNLNFNS